MNSNLSTVVQVAIAVISLLSAVGNGAKILSIAFWSSQSHKITYQPLLEALAGKGHNVTVLSPIPSKKSIPNLHEILTVDLAEFMSSREKLENIFEMKERNAWITPTHFVDMAVDLCGHTLEQPHVVALQQESFDLILMPMLYNECSAAYGHLFNVSTILISPMSVVGHISSIYGNPSPVSFVPNAFTGFSDSMAFFQRVLNLLTEGMIRGIYHFRYVPALEFTYREKFKSPNFPSIEDILKNSSLILSNTHVSLSKPRPLLPDIIEVGGMHCRTVQALPKDLEETINSSNGFILFSLGSTVHSSDMPDHRRLQFLRAFAKLKETVFWKWESDTMPDLPQNVKLSKWLPQQDLLGHPKIKAFITHGGFGSTTEAACHGVPLVGIPMFADQTMNMEVAEKAGIALTIGYNEISEESLFNVIQEVIHNSSFKENAKHLSGLLRDQTNQPLDRAVYWTEYVLRHNGAPHLRSSARDLNFYQYHSLDVISFLCIVGLLSVWGIFTSISCLTRRICKVKVADGSRETKQLILNSTNANATKKIRNSTKKQQ